MALLLFYICSRLYVPTTDKWDGDKSMIPYLPTLEENAMDQLDEFKGAHIPLQTKRGPALV